MAFIQEDLFSFNQYKIKNKIRLIELFAGVGSQAMALRNIGADFEHYRVCEFDKYAIKSYNAIHNTNFEVSDITQLKGEDLGIVDRQNFTYLLTYSFPCTDLSVAGKGLARKDGLKRGSNTCSGLLWEVERLLNEVGHELPQVLLMENVPQVIKTEGFDDWCNYLQSKGYVNHYKVLNAKNYGVAQNRERAFMISILSADYVEYKFPEPVKLDKTIIDYLEPVVNEKYYINNEKADKLILDVQKKGQLNGVVGNVNPSGKGINGNVYGGVIAPTLTTNKGEGLKFLTTEQNRTEQNRTEQNNYAIRS